MSSEPAASARLPRARRVLGACGRELGAAWPDQVPGLRSAQLRLSHHLLSWTHMQPQGLKVPSGEGGGRVSPGCEPAVWRPRPHPSGPDGAASCPFWWRSRCPCCPCSAPFDRIAEISFSVDADDDSVSPRGLSEAARLCGRKATGPTCTLSQPGAALFEACCSDHIQPFDEDDDLWEAEETHRAARVTRARWAGTRRPRPTSAPLQPRPSARGGQLTPLPPGSGPPTPQSAA